MYILHTYIHGKFKSNGDLCIIYTDEIVYDLVLSELAVFEENYALLYNTITDVNDPLIKI